MGNAWKKASKSTYATENNENITVDDVHKHTENQSDKDSINSSVIVFIGHNSSISGAAPGFRTVASLCKTFKSGIREHYVEQTASGRWKSLTNERNDNYVVYSGFRFEICGDVNSNQYFFFGNDFSILLDNFLRKNKIHKVCVNVAGSSLFFITDSSKVFGCGKNHANQLGDIESNGSFDRFDVSEPKLINSLTKLGCVIDIQSSLTYSIALTGPNRSTVSFITTYWNDYKSIPDDIINLLRVFCGVGNVYITKDRYDTSLWNEMKAFKWKDIIQIRSGCNHSLFLESNGTVWGIGGNQHGQLGLGHTDKVKIPTSIEYFMKHGIKIKEITCGFDHNLALDYNNNVYAWGYNAYLQCGYDVSRQCLTPQLINPLKDIAEIDCGSHHSYCKTFDGRMFFFGSNNYNECIWDNKQKCPAVILPHCANQRLNERIGDRHVTSVSLGYRNTKFILC
eukprot:307438_1